MLAYNTLGSCCLLTDKRAASYWIHVKGNGTIFTSSSHFSISSKDQPISKRDLTASKCFKFVSVIVRICSGAPNPYNVSENYWQYTSNLYRSTPPICNAVPCWLLNFGKRKRCSTPPICTSHLYRRYFWENTRGWGFRKVPGKIVRYTVAGEDSLRHVSGRSCLCQQLKPPPPSLACWDMPSCRSWRKGVQGGFVYPAIRDHCKIWEKSKLGLSNGGLTRAQSSAIVHICGLWALL